MKKILIIDEKRRKLDKIERIFVENGSEVIFASSEFLYEEAEKPDFAEIGGLIYLGNTPNYVKRAFELAEIYGIKRAVLVGSVYSYFDRTYPDKKLEEKHNYIRQANLCAEEAISYCQRMSVSVVELPFVEGEWPKDFCTVRGVIGIEVGKFFLAPEGGTAEITAENATKAIYAVYVNGENGIKYAICDKCRKYKEILQEKVGKASKIYEYPVEFDWLTAMQKKHEMKKAEIAVEFDIKMLYADFLQRNWYFDASEVKKALKYDELFENQTKDCPDDTNN